MDQVPIDSRVTNFRVMSIQLLSENVIRSRRSQDFLEYLVTFEISLSATEGVDIVEELSNIISKIDGFKPDSVLVTDQTSFSEEGEFEKLT